MFNLKTASIEELRLKRKEYQQLEKSIDKLPENSFIRRHGFARASYRITILDIEVELKSRNVSLSN